MGKSAFIRCIFFGGLIDSYDGVFGPGSGSFLIFIKVFGFDFVNASASQLKLSILEPLVLHYFFIPTGLRVLWKIGVLVAICNIIGSLLGVFLTLRYGSGFIRSIFSLFFNFSNYKNGN